MCEPTVIIARAQVHMNPGRVIFNEFGQKAGGEDMVSGGLGRTLQQIGGVALEVFKKFLADGKWPDTFTALGTGLLEVRVQVRAVGENTGVARRDRGDAGTRQRREIEQQAGPAYRRVPCGPRRRYGPF